MQVLFWFLRRCQKRAWRGWLIAKLAMFRDADTSTSERVNSELNCPIFCDPTTWSVWSYAMCPMSAVQSAQIFEIGYRQPKQHARALNCGDELVIEFGGDAGVPQAATFAAIDSALRARRCGRKVRNVRCRGQVRATPW